MPDLPVVLGILPKTTRVACARCSSTIRGIFARAKSGRMPDLTGWKPVPPGWEDAICGMALVPVTQSELKKIQPGGKVLYYTCPMPEHANVHEDKPGKCPKCGMNLVPVDQ